MVGDSLGEGERSVSLFASFLIYMRATTPLAIDMSGDFAPSSCDAAMWGAATRQRRAIIAPGTGTRLGWVFFLSLPDLPVGDVPRRVRLVV